MEQALWLQTNGLAHAVMLGVPTQRKDCDCKCGEVFVKTLVCEKCDRLY